MMNDETYIGLVNTHAKSDSSDNDLECTGFPSFLDPQLVLRVESCMKMPRSDPILGLKIAGDILTVTT